MIINALFPGKTPEKVKEMIVTILTSEYPLSIKELKLLLKKHFNKSVSYQAIHKEILKLQKEGILKKRENKYKLNLDWVKKVGFFSELIISNYTTENKNSILKLLDLKKEGDTVSFDFDSYSEIDSFFAEFFDYYDELFPKKPPILMHYSNNWWPLLYPMDEVRIFKKLQSKIYGVTALNYPINNWCCDFEREIGINVVFTNKKEDFEWTRNVFGDLLIKLYLDEKVNKEIKDFFEKNRNFRGIDLKELIRIIHLEGNFKLVAIKDSARAKKILDKEIQQIENIKLLNRGKKPKIN